MESTQKQIEELRLRLQQAVKEAGYNFLDPNIVKISQQLDKLIIEHMISVTKRP